MKERLVVWPYWEDAKLTYMKSARLKSKKMA